jgi:hypothetical protein
MRCSDALPPFSPHFVAFVWRYHAARLCSFLPQARRRLEGLEFWDWQPLTSSYRHGNDRDSQVPGEPSCAYALFSDPGRTNASGHTMHRHGPRTLYREGSTREVISGLNHTASALAVYASPGGLPAQDARLASGRWPSSPGRDWLPAEFLRKVSKMLLTSHPPSPSFAWRKECALLRFHRSPDFESEVIIPAGLASVTA